LKLLCNSVYTIIDQITPLPFYETHPPSLNSKGRGVTDYILEILTLPLLFKGRAGMG
jgi:hypothetical protein